MNPTGLSLLDLLRRRRELRLAEVVRLCGDLPRELDERLRLQQSVAVSLDGIVITLRSDSGDPLRLLDKPVTEWPDFTAHIAEPQEQELDRTYVSTQVDQRTQTGSSSFARLLYEMLGGKQRGATKQRPPPLPAINEEGNNLLREALAGEGERESFASFWQRWLRACEVVAQANGWRIPKWLLPVSQAGTALYLTPGEQHGLPVALIARPVFRLGRSRSTSDFPTRVLVRNGAVDEEQTVQISRIQALGEWRDGHLTLRDGNGEKASANGTLWNGEPLSAQTPTTFFATGELLLGGLYRLTVTPVPRPLGKLPEIENFAEWSAPSLTILSSPDFGAVVFRPPAGQAITRDAVWLGRGLGFNPARDRGPVWDVAGARSPAQFLHLHGCFWLANTSADQVPLLVNDAILKPGQIAPLADGQAVEIGGRRYTVAVEI